MPVPDTSGVPPFADFEMLKSKMNEIVQKYNNLLVNLDTLNVVSLDAKVITAGTITADKLTVTELSAISANLGTITAGLMTAVNIIGSYITTADGTYPRIDFSSTDNLLTAFNDALNKMYISPSNGGSPAIGADVSGNTAMVFQTTAFGTLLASFIGSITLQSDSFIYLNPSTNVQLDSWSKLYNGSQTLQQALDALSARITALGG